MMLTLLKLPRVQFRSEFDFVEGLVARVAIHLFFANFVMVAVSAAFAFTH